MCLNCGPTFGCMPYCRNSTEGKGLTVIEREKNDTIVNSRHALTWAVTGWLAQPGTFVFWSSHLYTTAQAAQREVITALMSTNLDIEKVIRVNGSEEIRLANGSKVQFRARVMHSHRGVLADKLILDEARELTTQQLGILLPCARANGGEVVYAYV